MKKIILAFLLLASVTTASAQWRHGGGHYVYRPGYGWVVPSVLGGVIGYEIARTRPPEVVYVPTPVYPAPAIPVMPQPAGYHWEAILDQNCSCYRTVLVPN